MSVTFEAIWGGGGLLDKYQFEELSLPGTFVPWNFRSQERKF